jgi:hypothetical protein
MRLICRAITAPDACPVMTTLNLDHTNLFPASLLALAAALGRQGACPALTCLSLAGNREALKDEAAFFALMDALEGGGMASRLERLDVTVNADMSVGQYRRLVRTMAGWPGKDLGERTCVAVTSGGGETAV